MYICFPAALNLSTEFKLFRGVILAKINPTTVAKQNFDSYRNNHFIPKGSSGSRKTSILKQYLQKNLNFIFTVLVEMINKGLKKTNSSNVLHLANIQTDNPENWTVILDDAGTIHNWKEWRMFLDKEDT